MDKFDFFCGAVIILIICRLWIEYKYKYKYYCYDPIYQTTIIIPKRLRPFFDHPYFQRTKNITQLGIVVQQFYPQSTHTRFEHQLGVMHMVGRFVQHINKHHNITHISHRLEDLIKLAAMYHDVGHLGGFNHQWDDDVFKQMDKNRNDSNYFDHEYRSVQILRDVYQNVQHYTDIKPDEINMVAAMIQGRLLNKQYYHQHQQQHQHHQQQHQHHQHNFIYLIVHGKHIDMDRLDYLARDIWGLFKKRCDFSDVLARTIIDENGQLQFDKSDVDKVLAIRKFMFNNVYLCQKIRQAREPWNHKLLQFAKDKNWESIEEWINLDDNRVVELIN